MVTQGRHQGWWWPKQLTSLLNSLLLWISATIYTFVECLKWHLYVTKSDILCIALLKITCEVTLFMYSSPASLQSNFCLFYFRETFFKRNKVNLSVISKTVDIIYCLSKILESIFITNTLTGQWMQTYHIQHSSFGSFPKDWYTCDGVGHQDANLATPFII